MKTFKSPSNPTSSRPRQAGFTLAEMTVSLFVLVLVLIAALLIFQFNTRVAAVQSQVTEMQQSLRISQDDMVRVVRMAGRGGLLQGSPNRANVGQGVAISVRNNVTGAARTIAANVTGSPVAATNSDVLIVRGIFESPIYQLRTNTDSGSFWVLRDGGGAVITDPAVATSADLHVCSLSPAGFPQDTAPLIAAINDNQPVPIVVVSNVDDRAYAVLELNPGGSSTTSALCNPSNTNAGVTLSLNVNGTYGTEYRTLSPTAAGQNMPALMTAVAYAGIIEEHRYYIRESNEIAGDATTPTVWSLSRARMIPGTNNALGATAAAQAANAAIDIANNVLDLQVSLGFDGNASGSISAGSSTELTETATGTGDDWLFNHSSDDPLDAAYWANPRGTGGFARLFYVRISTLARTQGFDRDYQTPALGTLQDRTYLSTADKDVDSDFQRRYRRRVLQTLIDLRNL